ncbi:MAG TPA: MerR family transcriptional regulator [Acidimicrobiia bacterium]
MKIGELARKTGVSTATIRFYEQLGLLAPARAENGYRRYEPSSVDRIRFIRDAQTSGLSLTEIGTILEMKAAGESTCSHVIRLLESHLRSIDRQAAELARTRTRLQEMLERARRLDPADCVDPNRCQTITPVSEPNTEGTDMTTETTLSVPEIHCDHCKMSLEGAVGALEGVASVQVSVPDATVAVAYDDGLVDLDAIKSAIEEQGYGVAN